MPLLGNHEQVDYSPTYDRITAGGCGIPITMGEAGTLVSIWAFFSRLTAGSGTGRYWAALYDGWELTGNALLLEADTYLDVTPADNATAIELPVSGSYSLSDAETYAPAVSSATSGGFAEARIMSKDNTYNITGHGISGYNYATDVASNFPDPMSRDTSSRSWCVWIEYDVGGGGSRAPRRRRAAGNVPLEVLLQLRQRGVEVVTPDSAARERMRSKIFVPQNWHQLGDFKNGDVRRNSWLTLPQR